MIRPRDGEINYEKIDDLAWNYMFVAACLEEEQAEELKTEWNKQGGHTKISWWKFVMENTKIELDLSK